MPTYEIEIKSLLRDKQKADELVAKMKQADPAFVSLGSHRQLNHYFVNGNTALLSRIAVKLKPNKQKQFKNLLKTGKDFSVRTANRDGKILLVIKASVDDTTSANGTARLEFETEVDLSLEQLDRMLLDAGFSYQAKWSRQREEFKFKDLNVSIDKNAGYGHVAEFEKMILDPDETDAAKQMIREIMAELEVEELLQDRLERMFDFYNKNWQDYYGTEKTFVIN